MKKKAMIVIGIAITMVVIAITIPKNNTSNAISEMPEFALLDDNRVNIPDYVQDSINKDLKEKYGDNYREVLEQNNRAAETATKIRSYYTLYRTKEMVYPNYYGGMYINDDQKLVLQIVEENIPNSGEIEYHKYSKITNIADNIEIEYVKYSYNELKTIDDRIIEYFSSEYADYNNLAATYVDVYSNKVIVELKENTIEYQNEFRAKVVDSKLIEFKQGQEAITAANPGEAITVANTYNGNTKYGFCTRGFRVKLYNQSGFLTSGHCTGASYVGTNVGVGTLVKYKFGGKVDAAFIQTGTSITNTLPSTVSGISTLNTLTFNSTSGQIIGMYGSVSGGRTGTITNSSISVSANNDIGGVCALITDQVRTNVQAARGDSGGPVFSLYKGESLGIVESIDGNDMIFTKLTNIASEFGVARY